MMESVAMGGFGGADMVARIKMHGFLGASRFCRWGGAMCDVSSIHEYMQKAYGVVKSY